MTPASVLDASALLAFLREETGADRVADHLERGCAMSAANWAEVLTKLADVGEDPDDATAKMADQGMLAAIEIRTLDMDAAVEVARLRQTTRAAGLSLGDRACVALGRAPALPVVTAERSWAKLKLGVEVQLIR